jgi:putative redox protein
MKAKATWKNQGLLFTGTADTGSEVKLASGLDKGESGFRPMELLAVGLAGCTGMDVISILQKKRQDVSSFEVQVETESAQDYPRVWVKAKIKYLIRGRDVNPSAVERAMQLSKDRYCPAQNMFNKVVDIDLEYEIVEDK